MGFFDRPDSEPEKTKEELIAEMVESGLDVLDAVRPLLDTVDGYRAECLRRGYSEEESRIMAVMFHNNMMSQIAGAPKS